MLLSTLYGFVFYAPTIFNVGGDNIESPVGFLLLRYSVSLTVESLHLLYHLVTSLFICSRRLCIDKVGVFHSNQISMCFDPHLN